MSARAAVAGRRGRDGTYRSGLGARWAKALAVCAALIVLGAASAGRAAVNADKERLARISTLAEPKGPVKRIHVQDYTFRLPLGIPLPVRGYTQREDDYDRDGRLVRREHIHSGGGSSTIINSTIIEYAYDALGNCTAEICRYNDMRPAYVSRNEYDADGNLLEMVRVDQTGQVSYRLLRDYDEAGRKLSETTLLRDDMLESRRTFTYDEGGKLVESVSYGADGRFTSKDEYTYDENGRETARRCTDGQGNAVYTMTYAYDEDGVVRRSVNAMGDGTWVSVYNEHGETIAAALYSPDDGELLVRLVRLFAYDEQGNATLCLELRTSIIVFGRQILVPYYAIVSSFGYYADEEKEAATDRTDEH
jgi:hypothetical protein